LCQLEGELEHPVDAVTAHDRLLDNDLALGVREHAAADRGILAFRVLANDPEVDVAGLAARKRAGDTRHETDRAQVDVLIELAPEQDQRPPQGDVIRHDVRPADRAEVNGVVPADLVLPVLRHHAAVLGVVVAGSEVEPVLLQVETVLPARLLQDADALRHHLLADAVPGDHRNAVRAVVLQSILLCGRAAAAFDGRGGGARRGKHVVRRRRP
jgi:hypothetical protein